MKFTGLGRWYKALAAWCWIYCLATAWLPVFWVAKARNTTYWDRVPFFSWFTWGDVLYWLVLANAWVIMVGVTVLWDRRTTEP